MERWAGRVAIVTGASSGFGYDIARTLVKHGMHVVGCARNTDTIQELAVSLAGEKGKLAAIRCDVSNESEVLTMFVKAKELYGRVDVCINNAGIVGTGSLLTGETDIWRQIMEINVLGLAVCTRETVKCFQELGIDDGHIINICSTAGHEPTSRMYSASKYMVTAMTAGVRHELRQLGTNVRVSQISPGLVQTDILKKARGLTDEESKQFWSEHPHIEAADITEAVVYVLSARPNVQIRNVIISSTPQDFLSI